MQANLYESMIYAMPILFAYIKVQCNKEWHFKIRFEKSAWAFLLAERFQAR